MNKKPAPTGPYTVGTTTFTVYTDREELRAPGTKRSVPVRVYYPVQPKAVAGMDRAPYMSRNVAEGLKKALHVPIRYDKRAAAGDNVSECYPDAPRIEGRRFPLVVYNHGLSSYRESNSFLCIELASQGYMVMAVGHPYDACCAELDDGTCLFFDGELSKKQYDPFWRGMMKAFQLTHTQGTDRELAQRFDELQQNYCKLIISRVHEWELDTLDAVRYARETWGAWIDFDRGIAATGHSLGGATVALSLENIKQERRLEFVGEGKRYWDLIRWGDAPTVLVPDVYGYRTNTWSESKKYLPFPQHEMDATAGLTHQLVQNNY